MADENILNKPAADEVSLAEHTRSGHYYRPNVDILERSDELTVLADIPGATSDDIDIQFEDGQLSIFARVQPRQGEQTQYLVREYGIGDYYRSFRVSEAIDAAKINAEYADGVLVLHLPKAEALKPRKINVRSA
jgi:HSP20 family protein